MAQNINLLPPEFSPQKEYYAIAKRIKTLSIIVYLLLIVIIALSAVGLLLFSRQTSGLKDEQDKLNVELDSLKQSEAQIIILKDRADKSKSIFDSNLTRNSLLTFSKMEAQTSAGIEYVNLTFEKNKISVSIKAANSKELEEYTSYLIESKLFQKINLTEMKFTKGGGYDASLDMEI